MSEGNELTVFGQLIAALFAEFTQRYLLDHFRYAMAGVAAPDYSRDLGYGIVDLSGRHFPDCCADWDAVLANENDFSIPRNRRDNDGRLPVHDCPRLWLRT